MIDKVEFDKICRASGRVAIAYRDAATGRIKAQVESENHAFQEMFQTLGWYNVLNNTASVYCVLTDDESAPDDSFPYIRGNIIGWGVNGQAANGDRGAYYEAGSFNGVYTSTGIQWRYAYSFAASAAQGSVKRVAITNQFGNIYNAPVRWLRYTAHNSNYLYVDAPATGDGRVGYRVTSTTSAVTLTKYDPLLNITTTADITALVDSISLTAVSWSIFYAPDEEAFYLFHRHATANNRRVYKISADFTTRLTIPGQAANANALNINNIALAGFAYGGKLYGYTTEGQFWSYDIAANVFTEAAFTYPAPPFIANIAQTANMSCLIMNGRAFWHNSVNGVGSVNPIVDIAELKVVSYLGNGDNTAAAAHIIKNPYSPNGAPITSSNANGCFSHRNAMCIYSVEGLREREPDEMMTVEYTVSVEYV